MAIYHYSAQIIGRSSGRSCVAAAAYRAGERIINERDGLIHDYLRRSGVAYTDILYPATAPEWVSDRAQLWNHVEQIEKRKDAQLAREINVALPRELTREHQIELLTGYCQENFVARGMIADIAIHDKNDGNPHAHIMLTTRMIALDGFGKKAREWNPDFGAPQFVKDAGVCMDWRESWAEHTNAALAKVGVADRIDHRSLADQGKELIPTEHEGHWRPAEILQRNGEATACNKEITEARAMLAQVEAEIERIKAEERASRLAEQDAAPQVIPQQVKLQDTPQPVLIPPRWIQTLRNFAQPQRGLENAPAGWVDAMEKAGYIVVNRSAGDDVSKWTAQATGKGLDAYIRMDGRTPGQAVPVSLPRGELAELAEQLPMRGTVSYDTLPLDARSRVDGLTKALLREHSQGGALPGFSNAEGVELIQKVRREIIRAARQIRNHTEFARIAARPDAITPIFLAHPATSESTARIKALVTRNEGTREEQLKQVANLLRGPRLKIERVIRCAVAADVGWQQDIMPKVKEWMAIEYKRVAEVSQHTAQVIGISQAEAAAAINHELGYGRPGTQPTDQDAELLIKNALSRGFTYTDTQDVLSAEPTAQERERYSDAQDKAVITAMDGAVHAVSALFSGKQERSERRWDEQPEHDKKPKKKKSNEIVR